MSCSGNLDDVGARPLDNDSGQRIGRQFHRDSAIISITVRVHGISNHPSSSLMTLHSSRATAYAHTLLLPWDYRTPPVFDADSLAGDDLILAIQSDDQIGTTCSAYAMTYAIGPVQPYSFGGAPYGVSIVVSSRLTRKESLNGRSAIYVYPPSAQTATSDRAAGVGLMDSLHRQSCRTHGHGLLVWDDC